MDDFQDKRRTNWFWDYNQVFGSNLSPFGKLVRLYLARCAGEDRRAWPSYSRIAKDCGISRDSAKRAVKELEESGWIEKYVQTRESGEHFSNVYHLCDPPTKGIEADLDDGDPERHGEKEGGGRTEHPPCRRTTGAVGAHSTQVGAHSTGVGAEAASKNTNITIPIEQVDDHTSYDHPDRRLAAPAGGGRKDKPDGSGTGQPVGTRRPADRSKRLRRSPDASDKANNRELIAELVKNYRAIDGVQGLKGDYAFIGGLYNEFGYQRVYEALDKLELTMAAEDIEKPLLYLRGILVPPPPVVTPGMRRQPKRISRQEREAEEKRRALLRSLYAN